VRLRLVSVRVLDVQPWSGRVAGATVARVYYYRAALTASVAAPALGPERGGTRVAVLGGGFRDAYTSSGVHLRPLSLRVLGVGSGPVAGGTVVVARTEQFIDFERGRRCIVCLLKKNKK
jgi:hypothetical protein